MAEPKRHKVRITVRAVARGECPLGMKAGDSWVFNRKTPEGICVIAFSALIPAIRTFAVPGGVFAFPCAEQREDEMVELACPDPRHGVIFEVGRFKSIE
ncbi:MAG: TIGR04076 family protein [Chloroflexi bacterium]|nr:TIGR04076 family protein [Chloroflexota bacterium]